MDGFKRPMRPVQQGQQTPQPAGPVHSSQQQVKPGGMTHSPSQNMSLPPVVPAGAPQQNQNVSSPVAPTKPRRRWPWVIFVTIVLALVMAGVGAYLWYDQQLSPLDSSNEVVSRFEVKQGESVSQISERLYERDLIRSPMAFRIYQRLEGGPTIKEGTCNLKPSESVAQILDKLTSGCHDFKSIMFYPGATLDKPLYKSPSAELDQDSMYIKGVLKRAGYSDSEIDKALTKQYSGALFAGKPAGTSLEGYVFGETYYVEENASVEQVLQTAFGQMESVITRNDIVNKFKAQGLDLYQGITLASIVQRELNCEGKPTQERKDRCYGYQQHIAQVFLKRLKDNITLGSDVTFIYAADKLHVAPTVDIDSPYNTRKNPGLPPGPIAVPGELALKAVANPSQADDLFFIAGDDGLIYFAKTDAEHQSNIKKYCQQLCSEL